jgi:hypothetical protein
MTGPIKKKTSEGVRSRQAADNLRLLQNADFITHGVKRSRGGKTRDTCPDYNRTRRFRAAFVGNVGHSL